MDSGELHAWSFACSACGKCCNTPPEMSVPELFHHQHLFVGCLAVRRLPTSARGEPPGRPAARAALLATRAFSLPEADRCPALGHDLRCSIHGDRKPAACSVVPLDATVPDRLQHVVLRQRSVDAAYLGAHCIVAGPQPGIPPLTRAGAVVDPAAKEALERRRRDLAEDRRVWGEAVMGLLRGELLGPSNAFGRIPLGGSLILSIAPVLVVLSAVSERCRQRCIEYLDAQAELLERPHRDLEHLRRANTRLRVALDGAAPPASRARGEAGEVEEWLGLSSRASTELGAANA